MVVSFLREGTDEKQGLYTDALYSFWKEVKLRVFALPYLLVLIVFFIHLIFLTSQTSSEEVSLENEWLDF